MKKLIIGIAALATCAVVFAAPAVQTKNVGQPKKGIPLAERKRMAQERRLKMTGGYVTRPGDHGKVVYVNGQDRVKKAAIEKQTAFMSELMGVRIDIVSGEKSFSVKDAVAKRKAAGANAAIFFVDEPEIAETLLVAPESCWAMVNVAALASDNPDAEKLEKRLVRETWRSYGHLLGAANTTQPKCVLQTVTKNADLDKIGGECFCPEPLNRIVAHLKAIGVDASGRTTYRQACQEGWAPQPTNDYQKAIWDQVYSVPDKPIKIEKK